MVGGAESSAIKGRLLSKLGGPAENATTSFQKAWRQLLRRFNRDLGAYEELEGGPSFLESRNPVMHDSEPGKQLNGWASIQLEKECVPLLLDFSSMAYLLIPGTPGPTGSSTSPYHQLLMFFPALDSIRFSAKHGSANGMEPGAKEAMRAIKC